MLRSRWDTVLPEQGIRESIGQLREEERTKIHRRIRPVLQVSLPHDTVRRHVGVHLFETEFLLAVTSFRLLKSDCSDVSSLRHHYTLKASEDPDLTCYG